MWYYYLEIEKCQSNILEFEKGVSQGDLYWTIILQYDITTVIP